MKHLIQFFIVCCFFGYESIQAQTAIAVAGGDASGAGGSVSYTIGQVLYTANKSSSGIVTQGVQQPYEIYVITSVGDVVTINTEISVYPNPTSDHINLKVDRNEMENLSFWLYDNNGSLIITKKITEKETVVELEELPSSAYYLRINDGQVEIKTFLIIKY